MCQLRIDMPFIKHLTAICRAMPAAGLYRLTEGPFSIPERNAGHRAHHQR